MSGIICSECGRDIDAINQDNMSYTEKPICEDCFYQGATIGIDLSQSADFTSFCNGGGDEA